MPKRNRQSRKKNDSKKKLFDELNQLSINGDKLSAQGRELTENGVFLSDIAQYFMKAFNGMPDDSDYSGLVQKYADMNKLISENRRIIFRITPILNSISGSVIYSSDYAITAIKYSGGAISPYDNIIESKDEIIDFHINRDINHKNRDLIILLGLNIPQGTNRSVLDLYDTSIAAFLRPVIGDSPAITSLIPLRSAIDEAIEVLLKKRVSQEKAIGGEKGKIISILRQLKYDEIPELQIEMLSDDCHRIKNEILSPAKDRNIGREEWYTRLSTGNSFLFSFLSAIDPTKFRI